MKINGLRDLMILCLTTALILHLLLRVLWGEKEQNSKPEDTGIGMLQTQLFIQQPLKKEHRENQNDTWVTVFIYGCCIHKFNQLYTENISKRKTNSLQLTCRDIVSGCYPVSNRV